MKKEYQIDKQRAVQSFRRLAAQDSQAVQLVIPLKEVVELIQRGLMNVALSLFGQVAKEVMDCEVTALVGPKNQANPARGNVRWGSEPGYCVVGGQKIPLQRPRVRDTRQKEVPLGSYELMQRASLMEESVWQKTAGSKELAAVAIAAERDRFTPCGACMDWIMQFATEDCTVFAQSQPGGPVQRYTVKELMPYYPH